MSLEKVFSLLDETLKASSEDTDSTSADLLRVLVQSAQNALVRPHDSAVLEHNLGKLIAIYTKVPDFREIECITSATLDAMEPMGMTPLLHNWSQSQSMNEITSSALSRWLRYKRPHPWCSMASAFLEQSRWTDELASIISRMAYFHPSSRNSLFAFLATSKSTAIATCQLACCISACFDTGLSRALGGQISHSPYWTSHFSRLLQSLIEADDRGTQRLQATIALRLMFEHLVDHRDEFVNLLAEQTNHLSWNDIRAELLHMLINVSRIDSARTKAVRVAVFKHGLRWATHELAGSGEPNYSVITYLGTYQSLQSVFVTQIAQRYSL